MVPNRLSQFLQIASKSNNISHAIRTIEGRQNDKLLDHKALGDAILSPHGLEDSAWYCSKYTSRHEMALPADPEGMTQVRPPQDMLQKMDYTPGHFSDTSDPVEVKLKSYSINVSEANLQITAANTIPQSSNTATPPPLTLVSSNGTPGLVINNKYR